MELKGQIGEVIRAYHERELGIPDNQVIRILRITAAVVNPEVEVKYLQIEEEGVDGAALTFFPNPDEPGDRFAVLDLHAEGQDAGSALLLGSVRESGRFIPSEDTKLRLAQDHAISREDAHAGLIDFFDEAVTEIYFRELELQQGV